MTSHWLYGFKNTPILNVLHQSISVLVELIYLKTFSSMYFYVMKETWLKKWPNVRKFSSFLFYIYDAKSQ